MHCKHMFSEIQNRNGFSTENIENFAINLCRFYSTQSTKNSHTVTNNFAFDLFQKIEKQVAFQLNENHLLAENMGYIQFEGM